VQCVEHLRAVVISAGRREAADVAALVDLHGLAAGHAREGGRAADDEAAARRQNLVQVAVVLAVGEVFTDLFDELAQILGKPAVGVGVIVNREAELLQIIDAFRAVRRLAGRLDGRQQQPDQDRDDRDHYEQFYEREPATAQHRATG
jgi:hypothetical protein